MKLISLNIWGGRIIYKLPEFFDQQKPDVVCMQEVNDIVGEMGGVYESLDMLQQKGGFADKFMASDLSYRYQHRIAGYGNAMLGKMPLKNRDVAFVQDTYQQNYDDNEIDKDHPRNFQHATIGISGKQLHIINFHGPYVRGSKDGNEDSLRHIQTIIDYVASFAGEPLIITGDFNLAPESESMQLLSSRFRNLPIEYGITSTYSSVLHVYNMVCDYIFVNEQVTVHSLTVPDDIVSDHKPLVMEFDV